MANQSASNESMRMQGSYDAIEPDLHYSQEGLLTYPLDPLQLEIEDDELWRIIDQRIDASHTYYEEKYDLFERRKRNELHYFGRHVAQKEKDHLLKDWESKFQDNVLYEIGGTIKPLAMSRVPDLMVTPAYEREDSQLMAQEISKCIDTEIKERENRQVLGLAIKHLPVYFTAVIKARWDNECDDYVFENIHPDLIEIDHTSPTKDADKMQLVAQTVPLTVQQICMMFPKSKEKFLEKLKKQGLMKSDSPSWALLATTVKIKEVWFHEYKQHGENEVERIDGVVWKYFDVILEKMKNPNFDYEGEDRYFAYDKPGDTTTKRALNENELAQILLTGQLPGHVQKETVYHNYFKHPRKPYYFMGYDQWGKQPYDETSWLEQNLQNQVSVDKRGKKIEETLDSRGHHVVQKGAISPADLEEIDWDAPNLDLSVDGNVNDVHAYIAPERPTPEEFREIDNLRQRMYAVAHSTAVRGEIEANAPATSNQIAREGDYTAADDLVEDTINDAAQWMAEWAMQFIKLRYTKDHFRWVLGDAGEMVWTKLNRNMIGDGMIVKVKASGTDKIKAQNNAIEMAKMEMTDPFTFFQDMGLSDPEGRTEKLILAKVDPMSYLKKVVQGLDSSQALAQALANAELPMPPAMQLPQPQIMGSPPSQQAAAPAGAAAPQQPTPQNTAQVPAQPPAGPPASSPRVL